MPISFSTDTVAYMPAIGSLIITDWLWDFGDGSADTIQNPTHTYAGYGTYLVCLTVGAIPTNGNLIYYTFLECDTFTYDTNGWVQTSCGSGGGGGPASCQAGFTYLLDTTANCVFCYQFTNTSSAPNAIYDWDFGDGNTSSSMGPSHAYSVPGTYNACLTVTGFDSTGAIVCTDVYCTFVVVSNQINNCTLVPDPGPCLASIAKYFYNQAIQQCDSFIWGGCDGVVPFQTMVECQTACGSGNSCNASFYPFLDSTQAYTVYLIENSTGTNLSYYWDFGDGSSSNQHYPTHVYSIFGTYDICLTVSDTQNCISTSCITLLLDSVLKTFTSFTLIVVPQEPVTGLNSNMETDREVAVYPNPANDQAFIEYTNPQKNQYTIRILDSNGELVFERHEITDSKTIFNRNGLSAGVYFVEIIDEGVWRSKFVMQ